MKMLATMILILSITAGSLFVTPTLCGGAFLGLDEKTIQGWLFDKEVVVGKRCVVFNRSETIHVYNISEIEIIDY